MIYLPISYLNYSMQYKFKTIQYNPESLIDTLESGNGENQLQQEEELYHKIGLFLEDSDILFLEMDFMPQLDTKHNYQLDINSFNKIVAISSPAKEILKIKLGTHKPIGVLDYSFSSQIIRMRNKKVAFKGAEFLLELIGTGNSDLHSELQSIFLYSINQFRNDVNFAPYSIFDHIVKYERDTSFPTNDLGYLLDCGRLLKGVIGYNTNLKDEDREKYNSIFITPFKLIYEEFKDDRNLKIKSLINRVKKEEALKEFIEEFKFYSDDQFHDHISSIILYLKFRGLIRDGMHEYRPFEFFNLIRDLKNDFPAETAEALVMLGMRFGINEFVSLFEITPDQYGVDGNETNVIHEPDHTEEIESKKRRKSKKDSAKSQSKNPKSVKDGEGNKTSKAVKARKTNKKDLDTKNENDLFNQTRD